METQEDSIDIAKLQRVALGLENEPSQIQLKGNRTIKDSDQVETTGVIQNGTSHPSDDNGPPGLEESLPDTTTPVSSRDRSGQHDTSSINKDPPLPEIQKITTSLPRPVKMSAELPSDTQVVSQTVFDNIIEQNKDAENGLDSLRERGATFMTYREGDSGHIDLLAGFDSIPQDTETNDENEDQSSSKLGESSPMHFQPNLFPESQRFLSKTPATAVKQGQPDGLSSVTPCASRNPLTADTDSSGGVMALSQVFRATQAPSSPLVNRQQSDPMSDRPSPNIPIQSHPLATVQSSPFGNLAATFPRDSSEGHLNYITMEESQKRRDKILSERMTRSADYINSEDQSDGEFEKEPSFVERLRRQKKIDEETKAQFAGLTAPARPSSRSSKQAEKRRSSNGSSKTSDLENTPAVHVHYDQVNGAFQNGAMSEEETEQEDPDHSVPRSQEQYSSVEDKENYNDTPGSSLTAAANAHDRLSQVLALQESPSRNSRASSKQAADVRHSRSPGRDEQFDGIGSSSQILVIKDSQQSPRTNDGDEEQTPRQPWRQDQPRHPNLQYQIDPSSDNEKVPSSPVRRPLRSSPPQRNPISSQPQGNHTAMHTRSISATSNYNSSQLPKILSAPDGARTQSSYPLSQKPGESGEKIPIFDPKEKSSSMPSRVAETPIYRSRSFGDVIPATSIPETSPNRSQNRDWAGDSNEAANQEDDDLPPVYPGGHERASQTLAPAFQSSSPIKALQNLPQILSSPSGKQRRALTEIAADASPQIGNGPFEVDIGILTADDREFSSVVSMSPIPPRKKRRGNDGKNIYASDPILPVTPRPAKSIANGQENQTREEPRQVEPSARPEPSAFQKRLKSSGRIETVWEVEELPQYHESRTARSRKLAVARQLERQPPKAQKPVEKFDKQPVAVDEPSTVPESSEINVSHELNVVPEISKDNVNHRPNDTIMEDVPALDKPTPVSENVIIAQNQVLAPWSGQKRAYYPATCFGTPIGVSVTRYVVRFEDSLPVEVPVPGVKRLEFNIGDAVKVDLPNVPKVPHIIRGFDDKLSPEDLKETANGFIPMTDVYGHSTVILGPKQRKSLPNPGLVASESTIKVPVSRIYLDTVLWNQLKDRTFTFSSGVAQPESRLQTPSNRHSTPASPGTRLSRSIQLANGLFGGMVFAVTYSGDEEAKSRIVKLIRDNDGRILSEGFNELFEFSSNVPFASPSKLPGSDETSGTSLRLTRSAEEVGFTCLIADQHSRREKYMQALALNIPCLSARWVEDCVAKNKVLDWDMYLLPAGESMYLHGATKSRMLTPSPAINVRLSETIASRPNLLNGQSVLLVMGRGKAEDKKKAYIFLTYAMGASKVERVLDLESAKAILDQQKQTNDTPGWDWVYVHGYDQDTVRAMMLGNSVASKKAQQRGSKKSKRGDIMDAISGQDVGLSTNVRIVGNEFVVQSLILGKLFEE